MAVDAQVLRFLLMARRNGVSLKRLAMIGRQSLRIDARTLERVLNEGGVAVSRRDAERLMTEADGFAEPLFRLLGARHIDSFDATAYERATVVHDMNLPIADEWKGRYTAVLDGGSLEHVFNVPCGLRNCLELVAPGGHFLAANPGNNQMGHGFYQFSPELFFRVLSAANGFEHTRVIACESTAARRWYEVRDPEQAGARIYLINGRPTQLFALSQKTTTRPILAAAPQQSDYSAKWKRGARAKTGWKYRLSPALRERLRLLRAAFRSPFPAKSYRKMDWREAA